MSATTRLMFVLAAAALAGACSDQAEDSTEAAVASGAPNAEDGRALISGDATATTAAGSGGGEVRGESLAPTTGDGPSMDAVEDTARLTRAVLALNVDNEGAINRTLLQLGAGVGKRDDARAGRVVEVLTRLAKNERAVLRCGALALLARVPSSILVGDPFALALFDPDAGVRRQAVIGKSRHGLTSSLRQLEPLSRDPDPSVRVAVAQSLACVAHPEAREMLAGFLADPSDAVVEAAAASLCAVDDGTPPPQAFVAARSLRPNVRCASARVLSRGRSLEALKQLQALAADEAPTVRQEAIWALSGLSEGLADDARAAVESVAFDAKKHGRAERFEALQGLARVESDPDHERLAAVALKDEDALMRIMAARSLALRGDARSLPALVALLDVKSASADGVAEEEAVFERRTADVVLSELAGVAPGSRSSADWRKALPDVAARLCAGRPDRPPQRLAQFW